MPRDAYLPFADGPRNCIGNSFAQMEGRIILAALVQHATFTLIPGQKIEPEVVITLHPRNGIKVKVARTS